MPAPCSLLLEVFSAISIYDDIEALDWEVSTDPAHEHPYLIAPRYYAEQEIEPIRCTASIGSVEIGVIDAPQVRGEQSTGWMTERVHSLLGRRCRLRRWVDDDVGWVVIADGPAGPPKMDPSYSAYRWTIKDTRETERKLAAFTTGGTSAIVPRGPLYGFGQFDDGVDITYLLDPILDSPISGELQISSVITGAGTFQQGLVNLASHIVGGVLDDPRLFVDEAAVKAMQIVEIDKHRFIAPNADVLWRAAGDTVWNIARPVMPAEYPQPFAGTTDVVDGDETRQALNYVTLFVSPNVPEGFPANGTTIELIVRHRGAASDDFPYYLEGRLGDILANLYDLKYTLPYTEGLNGLLYDPADLDLIDGFISRIRYDGSALADMEEAVLLRQTEPVSDVRSWTESNFYAPSGWVPALNDDMQISPVSRNAPESVENLLTLTDATVVPSPDWQRDKTVSEIVYNYKRYYIPADPSVKVSPDGLATRDVSIAFKNRQSELRYTAQVEEYDATAFSTIGTDTGITIPGNTEVASILAQTAKFNVLDRYADSVQSTVVSVRRYQIPGVKVGSWVGWNLMHLPSAVTGLRGSEVFAAQVLSTRDDDCTWRVLSLEESGISSAPPGRVTFLRKVDDGSTAGGSALRVISDVESI